MTTITISQKDIFSAANKIRGTKHCSMKEAYAEAKAMLIAQATNSKNNTNNKRHYTRKHTMNIVKNAGNISIEELSSIINERKVTLTYKNRTGHTETTRATMNTELIGKYINASGRKTPKNNNSIVFFDARHGFYRTLDMNNFISIQY